MKIALYSTPFNFSLLCIMHVVPSTIHHSYVALSNYACNERWTIPWLDLMDEWIEGPERDREKKYFGIRSPYQLLKHSYLFKQLVVVKLTDFIFYFLFLFLPFPHDQTTNTCPIAIWMENAFQSHDKLFMFSFQ